jgi:hypothetical protein|tara:strand:+ start:43589 stop:43957 length:369 start_codon:yes stop_codon:yes gene_type:complete
MDELELAWETYDFHTLILYELEEDHRSVIEDYRRFREKHLNPSQLKKTYMRKKLNKSFNTMINAYSKQITAIDDLISLHESGIEISIHRDVSPQLLRELKNTTSTLIEEVKIVRKEINEILR